MHFIIVAALLGAQPADTAAAPAQPSASADSRTTLWRDIRHGMTRAEVRALHPAQSDVVHHRDEATIIENYAVTDQCKATIRIFHERGTVDRVVARGEGSIGGRCADTVLTGLSSRYGESLSRERTGDGLLRRQSTVYVWNREGVTLRYRRFTGGAFGGAGLGTPSWELTYTKGDADIAL